MINRAYGIRARGLFHKQNKIPNQDYYRVLNNSKYILVIVSDGLGSKKFSHKASRRLTKIVKRRIKESIKASKFDLIKVMLDIQKEYIKKLKPYNLNNADATLQFVLETDKSILAFKCGDGIISIKGKDNLIMEEDDDNFVNETISFGKSQPHNWIIQKIKKEPDLNYEIFISTDGVSSKLIEDKRITFINEITKLNRRGLKKVLKNWPITKADDDKTIVIIK